MDDAEDEPPQAPTPFEGTQDSGEIGSEEGEDLATPTPFIREPKEEGEFDWDSTVQSAILGSFYWCYILSQVVGGVLTQHFGTKAVFGASQLVTAICSLCIPSAATLHYSALIVLRSIQGIASGLTWPAMYSIVGHWIPAVERSRFMSSFQGFSFGIGLTYPLCGFLIAHFGWRVVFYVTGTTGMLWCVMWYFLAFDTPATHPRIVAAELRYIESNVGNTVVGSKNGLLSGVPFLCSYLSSVFFCYLADVLVNKNLLTLTNVRKVFTAFSQIVPGLLLLAIGYLGCNVEMVLVSWFLAVILITASYAGAMASIVDIAPNLAGPVLAFAQTIHMTASFLSPLAAGFLLHENHTLEQWRHVFWVAAVVACVTYISFQCFGTADIQAWNYPDQKAPVPLNVESDSTPLRRQEEGEEEPATG
uniref:Major facilitator superfamily (MFS) profile domain-containing protein n=1 Tax=Timema cristinae TaxID=61476 RepID=A0A7R9D039_TIMCR|nr:unnamed protein product [Timema cristinae]